MILHSDLHYYPDASRRESVRLGSLLFVKDSEVAPGRCVVAFYQADAKVLMEAQRLSSSEFFASIFRDFGNYIRYVAENAAVSAEMSEEEVALTFISQLPHNLKAGVPEGWPPERVFTQAAVERQPITAFRVGAGHSQAALC